MRLLAAIGDVTRFLSAKHEGSLRRRRRPVSTSREKPIAGDVSESEGRSDLRGVMVEVAWVAVEDQPSLSAWPRALATRSAIVAIARKLLVVIWHVLSQQEADCHAQVEAVTRKLLHWMSCTGTTPGKKRNRLLLLYNYLDQAFR